MNLTFVIPVFNENDTLRPLVEGIMEHAVVQGNGEGGKDASSPLPRTLTILFVDDGSTDGSTDVLRDLHRQFTCVDVIRFNRNHGKTAALSAAFSCLVDERGQGKRGKGAVNPSDTLNFELGTLNFPGPSDIIFTMDADLQDDPKEIPRFVDAIEKGADLVVGWKKPRHDPWHKTLPSRVYNGMVSWLFHVELHDVNCGFKAFRPDIAKRVRLYGDLHRLIPVLAKNMGYSVTEIPVEHHPRRFGVSKYGFARFFKGLYYVLSVLLFPGRNGEDYSGHIEERLFH